MFSSADLKGVRQIRAVSGLPGFKASEHSILAQDKVRHVGEMAAICIAPTRAQAEDIAAQVSLDLEELPAVVDMRLGMGTDAPRLHDHWPDNVFLETLVEVNTDLFSEAAIKVSRQIGT